MLWCWAGPGLTSLLLLRDSCCIAELHFKLCGGTTTGVAGAMAGYGAALLGDGLCGIVSSAAQNRAGVPSCSKLRSNTRQCVGNAPQPSEKNQVSGIA